MATRLEEILVRVRDTLSDPNAERWADPRLIRLADDAQKSLVLHANYLRTKVTLPLLAAQAEYTLDSNIHKLTRVLNENSDAIPLLSHEQADREYGARWELDVGSPVQAIIYDKLNSNVFKVYPIPATVAADTITPSTPAYGVATSGDVQADTLSSPFGVVTGFTVQSNSFLTVYALANPKDLLTSTDALQINSVFDRALKFYVTGMALRDDKDTQNRQIGNEELQFYQIDLRKAMEDATHDFTAKDTQYELPYQRVI